ncbi:MAG TPA: DUF3592 domain-containing protein [Verrucomicrobiae bacterium]
MLLASAIFIVFLSLMLSRAVVRRFGGAKGFVGELLLKSFETGLASIWSRLVTVIGFLMVMCSVLLGVERGFFVLTAERTTGTVEALVESRDEDGHSSYAPKYRYRDAQGQEHTDQPNTYSAAGNYAVGQTVAVLYSPFWRWRSVIDDEVHIWGMVGGLAIIGGVLLVMGCSRLYWAEIAAHFQKVTIVSGWQERIELRAFHLLDAFFAMPGGLRAGTMMCVLMAVSIPVTAFFDPIKTEHIWWEWAALVGVALMLAVGLLNRSHWMRPVAVLTSLVFFYNAFWGASWIYMAVVFLMQVVVPVRYLYFDPRVKDYFQGKVARKDGEGGDGAFEFKVKDSAS